MTLSLRKAMVEAAPHDRLPIAHRRPAMTTPRRLGWLEKPNLIGILVTLASVLTALLIARLLLGFLVQD